MYTPSSRLCLVLFVCLVCLSGIIPVMVTAEQPEVISYYDIYADVNGAAIYFDNEYKGNISKGSLTVCVVSTKKRPYYRVTAKMDGYETITATLPEVAGELQHVPLHLQMKPKTGGLFVSSSPEQAELIIDGKEYGLTPQTVTGLAPGTYTIRLICPGYTSWSETAVVSAEKTSEVHAHLIKKIALGSLSISSVPAGADIYLGGRHCGTTPKTIDGISAGLHIVEIKMAGYIDIVQKVTVTDTNVTPVSFSLLSIEEERNRPGTLSLTSEPTGATVYLDSVKYGVTPRTIPNLTPGMHQIKLTYAGYPDHQSSVALSPGEVRTCTIAMQTPPGPEWLSVSIFSVIVSLLTTALFVTFTCRSLQKKNE